MAISKGKKMYAFTALALNIFMHVSWCTFYFRNNVHVNRGANECCYWTLLRQCYRRLDSRGRSSVCPWLTPLQRMNFPSGYISQRTPPLRWALESADAQTCAHRAFFACRRLSCRYYASSATPASEGARNHQQQTTGWSSVSLWRLRQCYRRLDTRGRSSVWPWLTLLQRMNHRVIY